MGTQITETLGETSEIRLLNDAELDEVNGGFIFLGVLALGFSAGFLGGVIAANYVYTGNVWGDI